MHVLQPVFMLCNGLAVVGGSQASHLLLCCSNGMGLLQHVQLILSMLNALKALQLTLQSAKSSASCHVHHAVPSKARGGLRAFADPSADSRRVVVHAVGLKGCKGFRALAAAYDSRDSSAAAFLLLLLCGIVFSSCLKGPQSWQ